MVIVWPNSDGTITLSQRTASGNVEPDGEQQVGGPLSTQYTKQKTAAQSSLVLLEAPHSSPRRHSPTHLRPV